MFMNSAENTEIFNHENIFFLYLPKYSRNFFKDIKTRFNKWGGGGCKKKRFTKCAVNLEGSHVKKAIII